MSNNNELGSIAFDLPKKRAMKLLKTASSASSDDEKVNHHLELPLTLPDLVQ